MQYAGSCGILAYAHARTSELQAHNVVTLDVLRLNDSIAAVFRTLHEQLYRVHRSALLRSCTNRCFGQTLERLKLTIVDVQRRDPRVRAIGRRLDRFPARTRNTNTPASVAWVFRD